MHLYVHAGSSAWRLFEYENLPNNCLLALVAGLYTVIVHNNADHSL